MSHPELDSPHWYSHSFRRSLVDMHIDDWNEDFMREFDPYQYFDCLQRAHIKTAMIYLTSHTGLCNWDTKVSRMHKGLQGQNKMKTLFDLCHQHGMDVVAYYSLIFNNVAYEEHPEWHQLDRNGHPTRPDPEHGYFGGGRFGMLCPNNTEYREFLKDQFREMCENFDFEGVFLDMTFWSGPCYCESCRKRYRAATGKAIPTLVDWNDPDWVEYQTHLQSWLGEFAAFCTAEWKKLRPGISVQHNIGTVCQPWYRGVDEKLNDANDYDGGDFSGGHLQESYICKLYRELTNNQPFEYMTPRCDPSLNMHTITKTPNQLRLHNHLTMAHHGAMLFIDAIDPVGTLNPMVYDRIGGVFEETMPMESYLTGDLMTEAALIMSFDSKHDALCPAGFPEKVGDPNPQVDSMVGMAKVLMEKHIPFTVLTSNLLDRLEGKKIAFLTNACCLRPNEMEQVEAYVRNGGCLYMSGTTDTRLAEKLLGLKHVGYTKEILTYQAPTAEGAEVFGDEYSVKYPLSFNGKQMLVENPDQHTVLATVTLPYTDPLNVYRFASIHSNPPGIPTEYPAMILGSYGKGKVLWSAATIEDIDTASTHDVVERIIHLLTTPELLKTDAPFCVEFTVFDDPQNKRYMLHIVNEQETREILPVYDFSVTLKLPCAGTAAHSLLENKTYACSKDGDYITLKIDRLDMAKHFVIPYQD